MALSLVYGTGFELGFGPSNWAGENWAFYGGGIGGNFYSRTYGGLNYSTGNLLYYNHTDGTDPGNDFYVSYWNSTAGSNNIWNLGPQFYLTDGTWVGLQTSGIGLMDGYLNGTKIVSGTVLPASWWNWNHHQIHLKIDSVNGLLEHKVNGILSFSYAGNTKPSTSDVLDRIIFYFYGSYPQQYTDDFGIWTGDWPGDIRWRSFLPTSVITSGGWFKQNISANASPNAPTSSVGAATGITGTYRWKVTFVDSLGETMASTVSSPDVVLANQKGHLVFDTGPLGTTARKIYRNKNGGTTYYLVTTIANNVDTTYDDSTADGSLPVTTEPVNSLYDQLTDVSDSTYVYSIVDHSKYELGMATSWGNITDTPLGYVHWIRALKDVALDHRVQMFEKYGGVETSSDELTLDVAAKYYHRVFNTLPDGSAVTRANLPNLTLEEQFHSA